MTDIDLADIERIVSLGLFLAYIVEVVWAIYAFFDIRRMYVEERGWRSVLWQALVRITFFVVAGGVVIGLFGLVALLQLPRLPLSGPVVIIMLMAMLSVVIVLQRTFRRVKMAGRTLKRASSASTDTEETDEEDNVARERAVGSE